MRFVTINTVQIHGRVRRKHNTAVRMDIGGRQATVHPDAAPAPIPGPVRPAQPNKPDAMLCLVQTPPEYSVMRISVIINDKKSRGLRDFY